jgi:hypothetical protein
MNNRPFNARSDAARSKDAPGAGDDVACAKCGAVALDTGLECDECGHDNYEAVTGKPFLRGFGVTITPGGARNWYVGTDGIRRWSNNDQPCAAAGKGEAQLPAVPAQEG